MPIAEMPEFGQISAAQAAARDSGQMRGKRMIGVGRRGSRTRSSSRAEATGSFGSSRFVSTPM